MSTSKKLPRCFFNPKEFMKALLNIRLCYQKGLDVNDMVRQLWQFHKDCKDEEHKRILEKLMTAINEFDDENVALTYAKHYILTPVDETAHGQMSYSYHYLKECFLQKQGRFPWLDDYSDTLIKESTIERSFDDPRYWMLVPPKEKENVITLCKEADLYCVVEENMTLNLVVMVNEIGQYIIADDLDVIHPFYLSYDIYNDYKFLSPVYKLRSAKNILDYLLAKVGYPYVPIRMKVIYTSPDLELTNLKEYTPEAEKDIERYNTENFSWYDTVVYPERWEEPKPNFSELWEGVDVIQVKDLDPKQGFLLRCPYKNLLYGAKDKYDREMIRMLYASLAATSMIYCDIYDNDGGNLNCITVEDMAHWCDQFHLLKSSKES